MKGGKALSLEDAAWVGLESSQEWVERLQMTLKSSCDDAERQKNVGKPIRRRKGAVLTLIQAPLLDRPSRPLQVLSL
jgi:hypothetical protein